MQEVITWRSMGNQDTTVSLVYIPILSESLDTFVGEKGSRLDNGGSKKPIILEKRVNEGHDCKHITVVGQLPGQPPLPMS